MGDIKQTFAGHLAGLSQGRNLMRGFGGNKAQRMGNAYLKASGYLFSISEQANRRVAGMAAYELAMKDAGNPYVRESVNTWHETYRDLLNRGYSTHEASAIVTAKNAIRTSQGDYAARAPFMRSGIGGLAFIFKTFQHKMLFNMWNYPDVGMRMALTLGVLGGVMGIPGAEDISGIIKAIGYRFFGKDWDVEREARQLAHDHLTAEFGKYAPDYFARGLASRGYGMPDLLDMLGEWSGMGPLPMPVIDRSKNVGLGPILPVDVGTLLGPGGSKDPGQAFADNSSRVAGIWGGFAYNLYKAMTDGQHSATDFQRWAKLMPSGIGSMVKAVRTGMAGGVLNSKGNMAVKFDPQDPEQLNELVAMGMGYNPARVSNYWDKTIATAEAQAYWDMSRSTLLTQAWSAKQGGDNDEWQRTLGAIRKFNETLPPEVKAKAITRDTIEKSFKARARAKQTEEAGLPMQKSNMPLAQDISKLYPGASQTTTPER